LWSDAGATWLSFVQGARTFSLRPFIVPDNLGITLGGSLSFGAFVTVKDKLLKLQELHLSSWLLWVVRVNLVS